jgi:xylulose-5-phosphate/fructose-6-phosphate phosphoketolase
MALAYCGETLLMEAMAAVSELDQYLPALEIRVVNVVNLMKFQLARKHPHGLTEADYNLPLTAQG